MKSQQNKKREALRLAQSTAAAEARMNNPYLMALYDAFLPAHVISSPKFSTDIYGNRVLTELLDPETGKVLVNG